MVGAAGVAFLLLRPSVASSEAPPEYIGSAKCATCHEPEYAAWKTSQHAVAMQTATPATVLGRFDGARLENAGVTSTFFHRDDRFIVNTEGADGRNADFDVRYTFGVYPLQQYLVELPGGRVQALTVAWDARPAAQGGQRWLAMYPDVAVSHNDPFHWTGRQNNWNFMCADCHSTGVRKGYVAAMDEFRTTDAEINVACEGCHGPGSVHEQWASYPGLLRRVVWSQTGLRSRLTERRGVRWTLDSGASIAHRSAPRRTDREIETCAQCHASRAHIADGYVAGAPLLDYYIPSLILPGLYFPDGQQRDEVYDYGSFLQSRMYRGGVTCADCHEPHTQKLRAEGNRLCAQCHRGATYDASSHHFHRAGSAGAQCVACHMPDTTYMMIDPRHDHSIRVPRPDLSVAVGVPNACGRCHRDRGAAWADSATRSWFGRAPSGFQRFATTFAADDRGDSAAARALAGVFADSTQPAIVRASALARLSRYRDSVSARAARDGTLDSQPLVRLAALQVLEALPPLERVRPAVPLLGDTTRAVRQGAAWVLAPVADSLRTPLERSAFARAAAELVASQRYNADREGNRLTLAAFYTQRGRLDSAVAEYRAALRLAPDYREARLGLAAVLSEQGQVTDAIQTLDSARAWYPRDRDVLLALTILSRNSGDTAGARRYATMLVGANPNDARGQALLRSLQRASSPVHQEQPR